MSAPEQRMKDVTTALGAAVRAEADGRPTDAIRILVEANRSARDPGIEEHLVGLRHRAFAALDPRPPATWIAVRPQVGTSAGLPESHGDELSPVALREALAQHGCLLVRGLIGSEQAAALADGIDQALDAFDAGTAGVPPAETSPWYVPFTPDAGTYRVGGRRAWMRASGGMWTVDSPRMLSDVLELVEETGIAALLEGYFGERPALSANKCNLRRVPVTTSTNWHQDGAFLGPDVHSLNLWLALSPCGLDAPGLDIVPTRLDDLLETGTDGAIFDWSVSPEVVDRLDTPVLRPEFEAGDALLFDHMFLHRTGVGPAMTRERHAIETWFFAPSAYPEGQIPIVY